jgi:MFS family permease
MESFGDDLFWIYFGKIVFYLFIAIFAIIGSIYSEGKDRRKFLKYWIYLGLITNILILFFQESFIILILGVLSAASLGLGFPSCFAFIADSTIVEERARVSGALILTAFIIIIFSIGIYSGLKLGIFEFIIISIILRIISLFALLINCFEVTTFKKRKWLEILDTPGFLLYFSSWFIFNLAGGISNFISGELLAGIGFEIIGSSGTMFQYIGVILAAIISGIASDRFGRKRIIIFGLVTLGISYLFLSISTNQTSYLVTRFLHGVAWGTILVNYFLTIIGDFGKGGTKEKFYAIGSIIPLTLFMIFQCISQIYILPLQINEISVIVTSLIFISLIPLIFSPETLSTSKIRERKIKEHLKKVQELVKEELYTEDSKS